MAASDARRLTPATSLAAPVDEHRISVAFERVPEILEGLRAAGPYASVDQVLRSAVRLLGAMNEEHRAALLNVHPRIGADPAGLSAHSAREQGAEADAATRRELASLNDAYELRFGFRCVVFVAGRSQEELLPILRERLRRTRDEELATGIDEFLAIARDRLSR